LETWFWKQGGIELVRDSYEKLGVYYLAPTIYGQEPIHAKSSIHSLDDMKGKKARFVGLALPVMQKLEVAATPMATAEVYDALAKGVIDFADRGGLAANYDVGLYEVSKYIILPGFHQPVTATGAYYYKDPNVVGLVTMEDMVVMMDEMGIDTGIHVDRLLELGTLMERTIGRRLRSEAILNGRIPQVPREAFKRKGLAALKEKLGEKPDQIYPDTWPDKARYRAR
jgi:hypothetical protein